MSKTKSVQIDIFLCDDDDDFFSSSSSSHLIRFSAEEKYRLVAPSWFTSKNTQDGDDDDDDEDDIIREKIRKTVKKEIGFSDDDFLSHAYQKSVSDLISTVDFLSYDEKCCEFIKGEFFRWAERTALFDLKVVHVKIDVLIREETDGEGFTGDEFDGELKPVIEIQDDDEEEEMAPAAVEVDHGVIEIEDDEEEEEVLPVQEEEDDDDDEVRELMEIEYGYMEVEEPDDDQFMVDDGGGGGIEEEQLWNGFVVEEEDNWFEFSKRNGVSRDMIEASIKTRQYDGKRDGDCMICMDGFSSKEEEEVAEIPCSHVFHKSCIVEWLELKNSCPLCRFEIHNKDDSH